MYDPKGPKVPSPYGVWCLEAMDAHGGWLATAADLVHFAGAITAPGGRPLLKRESVATMFAPPPEPAAIERDEAGKRVAWYGCGWMVRDLGKGRINTWHSGLFAGSSCLLVRRADGIDWAVLFNQDRTRDGRVPAEVSDPLLHDAAAVVVRWPEGVDGGKAWP